MLLGLALIAGPLLVAVFTAALQIRALADTGQKIVVEGVTAARASQELFSQISSLERTALLYDVLNDYVVGPVESIDVVRSICSLFSATEAVTVGRVIAVVGANAESGAFVPPRRAPARR